MMLKSFRTIYLCGLLFCLLSCGEDRSRLFTRMPASRTGIDFRNLLRETDPDFNIMQYPYFYNGGGVAVGDINNDGLPDIIFTGNMVKNRLYLNKGDFRFEDITERSGIAAKQGWCTGVTMADVNGDGLLDIYICRAGYTSTQARRNLLYINNGDLTFTERAAEYGLDDPGYSTQASFFDYDKDGDLDLVLINHSQPQYAQGLQEQSQLRNQAAQPGFGNKLFRNDGGHFTDVTGQAGISSNLTSFSLGLSTADIDMDGWPDIYITNDFNEPDYFYHNNHDGTFTESLQDKFDHISQYAMGCDVADFNNDGLPDLCVLDMLPEDNHARKMHIGADNYEKFKTFPDRGLYYQYMRNTLQKNNGDGTFSEIGQLAGIQQTDWSWAPLFADFDNDGLKDLFVSNGYKRDNTDLRFLQYSTEESERMRRGGAPVRVEDYVAKMSSIQTMPYIFRNTGNDRFEKKGKDWGLDQPVISNGAVYADLDNDGNLDLITNNMDEEAGIWRNNSGTLLKHHFLKLRLKGDRRNSLGYGAKVFAYSGSSIFYTEQSPVRGFQSSVDPVLHIGLGAISRLDSLRIIWPDDRTALLTGVAADQTLTLEIRDAREKYNWLPAAGVLTGAASGVGRQAGQADRRGEPLSRPGTVTPACLLSAVKTGPAYQHREGELHDLDRQHLLIRQYSHSGPCMTRGDLNGDGLEDLFVGGSKGKPAALYIQTRDHRFLPWRSPAIEADSLSEDSGALFFDADGDGDLDLYVVSGGYGHAENDPAFADRLYFNDGKGHFIRRPDALPANTGNKSCVRVCDIDGDGSPDIFVGGREVPGGYPASCTSSIYINDGHGKFTDRTEEWAPALRKAGIVTDAAWTDVDGDGVPDLILVGEWMPVKVFRNDRHRLTDVSAQYIPAGTNGWWNCLLVADLNGDGRKDLVLGNYGWNGPVRASATEPVQLYTTDIDGNGIPDPVLTAYSDHISYPFMPLDDILTQVPALKKKFPDYAAYADARIGDLIPPDKLKATVPLNAYNLSTVWLENTGKGFVLRELPVEAQYGPVYSAAATDINGDGYPDLILCGGQRQNRIRFGRDDAGHGVVLLNDGRGHFRYLPPARSGLTVRGDVRSMEVAGKSLLIGVNGQPLLTYRINAGAVK